MCLMRVDADREAGFWPQLEQPQALLGFFGVTGFENDQRTLEARRLRACHHVGQVDGKRVVGEVAVRVDHAGGRRSNSTNARSRSAGNRVLVAGSAKLYSIELRTSRFTVG